MQSFQRDCIELAFRRFHRGEVDRRTLLAGLAALGVGSFVGGEAQAQGTRKLVMVNWGGLANQGFGNFYGAPFVAANPGWTVEQDSTGPSAGRIRSMVESGRVTWDMCDSSASSSFLLGRQNLLTKIDYSIVKKEDTLPVGFALEYGAAPYSFSSVLCYDSAKFPNGGPTSWKDFYDLEKFPGTRLMRRDALATLDAAQMALGKDPANLYPLDIDATVRKAASLRRNAVFWSSGSESEQFLRTGEAVMGMVWHTRATVLERETNGRIKFLWPQGLLQAGIMVIPRGNPGGEGAQRLLASMLHNPEPQVGLLQLLGNGPTNPRAAAMVPQELRSKNPTDPENERVQVVLNGEWWGQNYQQANADYIDAITG